jgi:hypothetical protein
VSPVDPELPGTSPPSSKVDWEGASPEGLKSILRLLGPDAPPNLDKTDFEKLLEIYSRYKHMRTELLNKSDQPAEKALSAKEARGDFESIPIAEFRGIGSVGTRDPHEFLLIQNRGPQVVVFRFTEADGGEIGRLVAERRQLEVGTIAEVRSVLGR